MECVMLQCSILSHADRILTNYLACRLLLGLSHLVNQVPSALSLISLVKVPQIR